MRMLLALAALLAWLNQGMAQQQPSGSQQPSAANKQGTYDAPFVVEVKPAYDADNEANRRREEDKQRADRERELNWATWAVAGFTLLLVAVAGAQIFVFLYQLGLMREGVDDAKTAADAAKEAASAARISANAQIAMAETMARPRIRVRNIVVHPPRVLGHHPLIFHPNQLVSGQLYAVNIGGSRARLIEVHCQVFWPNAGEHTLPMERPYEGQEPAPYRVPLESGESTPITFGSDRLIGARESDEILSGMRDIYVLGNIAYADNRGVIRRTAFCRKYDRARRRFVAVDDPDYEHEE
jgi:hypothetical protein